MYSLLLRQIRSAKMKIETPLQINSILAVSNKSNNTMLPKSIVVRHRPTELTPYDLHKLTNREYEASMRQYATSSQNQALWNIHDKKREIIAAHLDRMNFKLRV